MACVFFILSISKGLIAQTDPPFKPISADIIRLSSKILGEDRKIYIYVPPVDTLLPDKRYPVLYVLDGDNHFSLVAEYCRYLSRRDVNVVPEMIIVGIPNTHRTRDLTPTHSIFDYDGNPDTSSNSRYKSSGGGNIFLQFIGTELIPYIDAHYKTKPFRIFAGHSFGGITTINCLLTQPDMFGAYIAISPSFWWDKGYLLSLADEKLINNRVINKMIFYSDANEGMPDDPAFHASLLKFDSIITRRKIAGLDHKYVHYPEDTHMTEPVKAYYDALRFIFRQWDSTCSFAQRTNIDRAPSGRENYLPVEGGSIHMHPDSSASLASLIARLSGNWQFIETGKRYWIGYTNDMFSIAARGDSAIGPLVRLAENSSNHHARVGAIYTIHLIGIERKIVDRRKEEFVDTNARKALLYLLRYPEWQPTIMELLMRDPWPSDVPDLIGCLTKSDSDCWAVVDGLNQYRLKDPPLHQKIPASLGSIMLKLQYSDSDEIIDSLIGLKNDSIIVERALLDRPLCGNMRYKHGQSLAGDRSLGLSIKEFLDPWDLSIFRKVGNKVQYYVEDGKLYICTATSAKKRWIDWYMRSYGDSSFCPQTS